MSSTIDAASAGVNADQHHRRAPPRLLCYGDSLTAGYTALTKYTGVYAPWATQLADALGVAVDHVGMCGWTASQMVDGLDSEENVDIRSRAHRGLRRLLEDGSYSHVLLMAGTNDLKTRTASEIAESLVQLHGDLRVGVVDEDVVSKLGNLHNPRRHVPRHAG